MGQRTRSESGSYRYKCVETYLETGQEIKTLLWETQLNPTGVGGKLLVFEVLFQTLAELVMTQQIDISPSPFFGAEGRISGQNADGCTKKALHLGTLESPAKGIDLSRLLQVRMIIQLVCVMTCVGSNCAHMVPGAGPVSGVRKAQI